MVQRKSPAQARRPESRKRLTWRTFCALGLLAVLPGAALVQLATWIDPVPLSCYLMLISGTTYVLYWRDKKKALAGEWRIPESELHLAELVGGWPAAFLAQRILRHKISKRSYQLTYWLIVTVHQYAAFDLLLKWRLLRKVISILPTALR